MSNHNVSQKLQPLEHFAHFFTALVSLSSLSFNLLKINLWIPIEDSCNFEVRLFSRLTDSRNFEVRLFSRLTDEFCTFFTGPTGLVCSDAVELARRSLLVENGLEK